MCPIRAGTEQLDPNSGTSGKIDERHLELRALARVYEVAVRQHGGSASDGGTVHGRDQRLVEIDQRIHQPSLRRFSRPWRILQKILDIVARAEGISCAMPEHDTCAFVLGRVIEDIRERHVHARGHRVSFCRTIQFNAKDASGTFGNNLVHRLYSCACLMSSELGLDAARLPGDIDCSVVIAANETRHVARGPTPSPRRQISCLVRALRLSKAQCVAHFFLFGPQIAQTSADLAQLRS